MSQSQESETQPQPQSGEQPVEIASDAAAGQTAADPAAAVPSSNALADIDPLDDGEHPDEAGPAEIASAAEDEGAPLADEKATDEDDAAEEQVESDPNEAAPPALRELSRSARQTYERQRQRFAACSRCSYFVADCLVYVGHEALESAILAAGKDYVQLEGDRTFARLVMYAYGYQLDYEFDYFDGACPECRRRIVLDGRDAQQVILKLQT